MIKTHYRSNLNFTVKGLGDSAQAVTKLTDFLNKATEASQGQVGEVGNDHPIVSQFLEALADDVNISAALAVVLPWISKSPEDPAEALGVLHKIDGVLGILGLAENGVQQGDSSDSSDFDAEAACREMDQARADKDYERADSLRQQIIDAGYDVQTGKDGTTAKKKLA